MYAHSHPCLVTRVYLIKLGWSTATILVAYLNTAQLLQPAAPKASTVFVTMIAHVCGPLRMVARKGHSIVHFNSNSTSIVLPLPSYFHFSSAHVLPSSQSLLCACPRPTVYVCYTGADLGGVRWVRTNPPFY